MNYVPGVMFQHLKCRNIIFIPYIKHSLFRMGS